MPPPDLTPAITEGVLTAISLSEALWSADGERTSEVAELLDKDTSLASYTTLVLLLARRLAAEHNETLHQVMSGIRMEVILAASKAD